MDVEATPAHRTPGRRLNSTRTTIDRVEQRFDIRPRRLVGDTAYGAAPLLGWMVKDKQIEPHVPVWDKTVRKDGSSSIGEFQWQPERNEYGVALKAVRCATTGGTSRRRAPASPRPTP